MSKEAYVKPMLEELALESNNTICSCGGSLINMASPDSCSLDDQALALIEATGANFAEDNGCSTPLEGYCYMTSALMLFTS